MCWSKQNVTSEILAMHRYRNVRLSSLSIFSVVGSI